MKLAFLLQTIKSVLLGYNFRLYTYGPFDSDVLIDLGQAESLKAVESSIIPNSSGYGYEFAAGSESGAIKAMAGAELTKHHDAITWALREFGKKSAADLKLLSTIIYADREASQNRQSILLDELCRQVREIKPKFSEESVLKQISYLAEKGLLAASDRDGPFA